MPFRNFLLLFTCWFSLSFLAGQCADLVTIRSVLADSAVSPRQYAGELLAACPTAADSLSKAFYSRSLYYNGLGDRKKAIEYGELALVQLHQIDTSLQLGKMNFNLGLFNYWEENFRESLYYMRQAAAIFPRVDHHESERRWLLSLENIGMLHVELGDYQRAREAFLTALGEAEQRDLPNNIAQFNRRLGEVYEQMGQMGAAAGAMDVSIAASDDPYLNAVARVSRISLNYNRGRLQEAQADFDDMIPQADFLDEYNLSRLYSLGILLQLKAGNYTKANDYFEENLLVARSYGTNKIIAQAWDNGGEIGMNTQDYALARERFSKAIALLTPGFRPTPETIIPTTEQLAGAANKVDLVIYLGDLARALSAGNDQDDALAALYAVDQLVDQIRAGLGGEVSALFWRKEALPVYEQAIRLAGETNQAGVAFYFFEKSRAILLLEALAEADLRQELPRSANRELTTAEQALRRQQQQMLDDPENPDSLRREVNAARETLLATRSHLAEEYPRLQLNGVAADVVDVETARTNLKAAEYGAQLQYFVGEKNVYLMTVLPGEEGTLVDLGVTDSILAVVRPLLGYFTDAKAIDRDPGGYDRAAHLAYTTLVAPAAAPENIPLLIVPDGLLSYLPFAALKTDGRYLIERNPVSYAQSATLFGRSKDSADGDYRGFGLAFTPFTSARSGQDAAALPYTADEARALDKYFGADRLDGPAATRAALLDSLPYGILHLGTHAQANRTAASAPRILTATGPLYLPDVYGMQLNGALVTLSACNSNVGPLARGEGVLGLGRAFRAAGAGGVVASLWSLNDRATADITGKFYAELADGQSKPLALHAAQLDYLQRSDLPAYLRSPYYWAGLTYYGDAGKVRSPFRYGWWLGALTALIVLGGIFWASRQKA